MRGPRFLRSPGAFRTVDRRIVTLMVITGFFQGFAGSLLTTTLPYSRLALGLSEGGMSLVLAITRLGSFAALALSTYADQKGRRRAFLAAFVLLFSFSGATALVPAAPAFAVSQSVARAATVALSALATVLLIEVLTPAIRAFGISFYAAAGSLGGGTALLLLPLAAGGPQRWRVLFGLSVLGLVAYPLLRRVLAESPVFRPPSARVPVSAVLRPPHAASFWRLATIALLVGAFASPAISFVLERLINDLDWSAGTARFLLIGTGAVAATGLFMGGRIADTWGRRPTTVASLCLGAIGGVGVYWLESGWLLGTALTVGSFGSSAFIPAFSAHRSELFPTSVRATAAAWINNAGIVGSLASFLFGFVAFDRIGLPSSIAFLGIGVLGAAAIVLGLAETRGLELKPG